MIARPHVLGFVLQHEPLLIDIAGEQPPWHHDDGMQNPDHGGTFPWRHSHLMPVQFRVDPAAPRAP